MSFEEAHEKESKANVKLEKTQYEASRPYSDDSLSDEDEQTVNHIPEQLSGNLRVTAKTENDDVLNAYEANPDCLPLTKHNSVKRTSKTSINKSKTSRKSTTTKKRRNTKVKRRKVTKRKSKKKSSKKKSRGVESCFDIIRQRIARKIGICSVRKTPHGLPAFRRTSSGSKARSATTNSLDISALQDKAGIAKISLFGNEPTYTEPVVEPNLFTSSSSYEHSSNNFSVSSTASNIQSVLRKKITVQEAANILKSFKKRSLQNSNQDLTKSEHKLPDTVVKSTNILDSILNSQMNMLGTLSDKSNTYESTSHQSYNSKKTMNDSNNNNSNNTPTVSTESNTLRESQVATSVKDTPKDNNSNEVHNCTLKSNPNFSDSTREKRVVSHNKSVNETDCNTSTGKMGEQKEELTDIDKVNDEEFFINQAQSFSSVHTIKRRCKHGRIIIKDKSESSKNNLHPNIKALAEEAQRIAEALIQKDKTKSIDINDRLKSLAESSLKDDSTSYKQGIDEPSEPRPSGRRGRRGGVRNRRKNKNIKNRKDKEQKIKSNSRSGSPGRIRSKSREKYSYRQDRKNTARLDKDRHRSSYRDHKDDYYYDDYYTDDEYYRDDKSRDDDLERSRDHKYYESERRHRSPYERYRSRSNERSQKSSRRRKSPPSNRAKHDDADSDEGYHKTQITGQSPRRIRESTLLTIEKTSPKSRFANLTSDHRNRQLPVSDKDTRTNLLGLASTSNSKVITKTSVLKRNDTPKLDFHSSINRSSPDRSNTIYNTYKNTNDSSKSSLTPTLDEDDCMNLDLPIPEKHLLSAVQSKELNIHDYYDPEVPITRIYEASTPPPKELSGKKTKSSAQVESIIELLKNFNQNMYDFEGDANRLLVAELTSLSKSLSDGKSSAIIGRHNEYPKESQLMLGSLCSQLLKFLIQKPSKPIHTNIPKPHSPPQIDDDEIPSSAVELNHQEKYLQKLSRQERVIEEVKVALKPFYQNRSITKEDYKEILRRAVPRVSVSKYISCNLLYIVLIINNFSLNRRFVIQKTAKSMFQKSNLWLKSM